MAALGLAWLMGGSLACGPDAALGDIHTFQQYQVFVDATDQPGINTGRPARELLFQFQGRDPRSPDRCASFGNATATFAGQPIAVPTPGGWVKQQIPTNTAPGETFNGDHCIQPFIDLTFDLSSAEPQGEPQDGVLAIDGAGVHLEVPFDHPFGSPAISLVSNAADKIVLRLQSFLVAPTIADVDVTFSDQSGLNANAPLKLQKTALGDDGLLELSLDRRNLSRQVSGNLLVSVNLGRDELACVGFMKCVAKSRFVRFIAVDIAPP